MMWDHLDCLNVLYEKALITAEERTNAREELRKRTDADAENFMLMLIKSCAPKAREALKHG